MGKSLGNVDFKTFGMGNKSIIQARIKGLWMDEYRYKVSNTISQQHGYISTRIWLIQHIEYIERKKEKLHTHTHMSHEVKFQI
jgi:hypothetical protein